MPRRAQNPFNPITKVRKALGTADHVVSREELAARCNVALGSLKNLESGRYSLSPAIAAKISLATGANPFDLLRNVDPIRDMTGQPLSPESVSLEKMAGSFLDQQTGFENDQYLTRIAFGAAKKKLKSMQFRFVFLETLVQALEDIGLTETVTEELTEHLGEFNPFDVPYQLRPHKGPAAKKWEAFERQVRLEQDRLWTEKQNEDPALRDSSGMSPEEKRRTQLEAAKFEQDLWTQALANVAKTAAQNRA